MKRAHRLVVALGIAACSAELRSLPARDLVTAASRALATFEASAATQALLDRARDAAFRLDASALYEALPDRGSADRRRALWFEIREASGRRMIEPHALSEPSSLREVFEPTAGLPYDADGAKRELGRYTLLLASMPLASGDYRLRVSSTLDSGRGDVSVVWRALPELVRHLERGAPAEEARRAFPRTTEFLSRYLDLTVTTRSESPRETSVEIRVRGRRAQASADYPKLAHYVERVARRVKTDGSLEHEDGANLATWRFRGEDEGLSVSFTASEGRLRSSSGELVELSARERYRLVQSTSAEVLGVTTSIAGMRSEIATDPGGGGTEVAARANRDPAAVRVEGALFGVIPIAAIDAMLPGTLEGSVRGILATLLHGREGRGVEVVVRSRTDPAAEHVISSTLVTDVPATSFSRRALQLAAALIEADNRERDDVLRFARDLFARLVADLAQPQSP